VAAKLKSSLKPIILTTNLCCYCCNCIVIVVVTLQLDVKTLNKLYENMGYLLETYTVSEEGMKLVVAETVVAESVVVTLTGGYLMKIVIV
jgi:hypothetical protein